MGVFLEERDDPQNQGNHCSTVHILSYASLSQIRKTHDHREPITNGLTKGNAPRITPIDFFGGVTWANLPNLPGSRRTALSTKWGEETDTSFPYVASIYPQ